MRSASCLMLVINPASDFVEGRVCSSYKYRVSILGYLIRWPGTNIRGIGSGLGSTNQSGGLPLSLINHSLCVVGLDILCRHTCNLPGRRYEQEWHAEIMLHRTVQEQCKTGKLQITIVPAVTCCRGLADGDVTAAVLQDFNHLASLRSRRNCPASGSPGRRTAARWLRRQEAGLTLLDLL